MLSSLVLTKAWCWKKSQNIKYGSPAELGLAGPSNDRVEDFSKLDLGQKQSSPYLHLALTGHEIELNCEGTHA